MEAGGAVKIHKTLYKTDPKTVAIAADATVGSFTIHAWALTHTIVLVLPDWTNAVTAIISIENSDGNEIYASSSLAESSTHILSTEKPLVGTNTIKITLSGVPGGGGGNTITTIYLAGN